MYSETDGVIVICQREICRNDRPLLSIELPVYYERATFERLIKSIFEKTFDTVDREIIIKGLVPIEIPLNYVSRSFGEGKKVRLLLDPILWIIALLKFRYGRFYSNTTCERR